MVSVQMLLLFSSMLILVTTKLLAGTDGGGSLDPVISVLNHGSIIDVQPVVSSDRKYITLEVRPTQAVLLAIPAKLPTSLLSTLLPVGLLPRLLNTLLSYQL